MTGNSPQQKSIIPTAADIAQTSITLGVQKALFQVAEVNTGVIKWFNADLVTRIVPTSLVESIEYTYYLAQLT